MPTILKRDKGPDRKTIGEILFPFRRKKKRKPRRHPTLAHTLATASTEKDRDFKKTEKPVLLHGSRDQRIEPRQ